MTTSNTPILSFNDMNLPENLKVSLAALNFSVPTPIQSQTIPLALEGQDVLGSAQTGTGKTLAFAIPLIAKICQNPTMGGIILTPTRELAQQISTAIRNISAKNLQVKTTLLIGGDPIFKQMQSLKNAPQIIVGTPGRVIDHLERGTLKTDSLNFLVLDEADRMFDMGFGIQLDRIMSQLPKDRQTLMFSATFPASIEKLASKHLNNPARVSIGSVVSPVKNIKQDMVRVSEGDKYARLLTELNEREGSVIIFVKTKMSTERLAEKLTRDNHESIAIHGDLKQQKRERVIGSFRKGNCRIMVATDVVARGLDVPGVGHVINYDLPQCPEDYIHRIGRTARAGAQGASLCLITPTDAKKWFAIQKFMDPSAKEDRSYSSGGRSSGGGERSSHRKSGNGFGRSEGRSEGRSSDGRSTGGGFGRSSEGRSSDGRSTGTGFGRSGAKFESARTGEGRSTEGRFARSSEDRSQAPRPERRFSEQDEARGNRFEKNEGRPENRPEPRGPYRDHKKPEGRSEGRSDSRSGDARPFAKKVSRPFKTDQKRDRNF